CGCAWGAASASRRRAPPGYTWNGTAARGGAPSPSPGPAPASSPGLPAAAGDDGQPGLGLMRIDRDVDLGGLDGVHRPPLGETVAYLFLPDAARSPVTSLAVAEAEHIVMSADRHRGAKFFREPRAVVVVPERVEEPAIEDRVELLPEAREHQGVQLEEPGFQPPVTSLGVGTGDGGSGDVETSAFQAQGGRHQGMFTSAATRVQHPPGQQATLSQLSKCRLGPADVPGRNSLHVNGIEILRLSDVSVACQYAWTFRLGHDPPSL